MDSAAAVVLGVAALAAAGNWLAVARENKRLEYVCKPLALAALIVVAVVIEPDDPDVRGWFVAALVLSLAGDVFLMLPADLFVPGLASFLLGHVAYIVGFAVAGTSAGGLVVGALGVAAVGAVIGRRILGAVRRGPEPALLAPVTVYLIVISLMVVSAVGTGDGRAIVGAGLFYVSDALIAWSRFVQPLWFAPVTIMVTYHLAQAMLVLFLL